MGAKPTAAPAGRAQAVRIGMILVRSGAIKPMAPAVSQSAMKMNSGWSCAVPGDLAAIMSKAKSFNAAALKNTSARRPWATHNPIFMIDPFF